MASEKLYTMAGVSTLTGETKVRFTSRHAYIDTLQEAGHTNILITELPEAMNRIDAAKFLKGHIRFQDNETQAALDEYITKQTEKDTGGAKTSRRGNSDDMAERIANRVVELLCGASDDSRQKLIERIRAASALLEDEEDVDMIG